MVGPHIAQVITCIVYEIKIYKVLRARLHDIKDFGQVCLISQLVQRMCFCDDSQLINAFVQKEFHSDTSVLDDSAVHLHDLCIVSSVILIVYCNSDRKKWYQ